MRAGWPSVAPQDKIDTLCEVLQGVVQALGAAAEAGVASVAVDTLRVLVNSVPGVVMCDVWLGRQAGAAAGLPAVKAVNSICAQVKRAPLCNSGAMQACSILQHACMCREMDGAWCVRPACM